MGAHHMAARGARRRRRGHPQLTLSERFQQFLHSWEAVIGFSVIVVLGVLVAGIFRFSLPFDFLKPPPPPDVWGNVVIPANATAKVLYIGDVSNGASIDTPGTRQAVEMALKE